VANDKVHEDAKGLDRRRFLKNAAVVAFGAPVVASFSMDGVNAVFAGAAPVGGGGNLGNGGNLGGGGLWAPGVFSVFGYEGTPYTQQFIVDHPGATYTASGLPPNLTISPQGTVSGLPTLVGTFGITVFAFVNGSFFSSHSWQLVIFPPKGSAANGGGGPVMTWSPPNGTQLFAVLNTQYHQTFTVNVPFIAYVISGNVPPGLALSPQGILSGHPSQDGSFTFTITALSNTKPVSSATYTLNVNSTPI
jgi:hypothetical protein